MKNKIISNISFNFLIKAITYLFSFLTLMYVTRILQPEAFGRTSFASSIAGYFVMLANLGMPIYAMRACAEKRDDRRQLSQTFKELWSISIVLSVISAVFFIVCILFVPKLRNNTFLLVIYGSSIIFQMLGCEWLFKGLERFRFLAVSGFICKAISLVCILLFVHSTEHIYRYALLSVLTSYGSGIACFVMLHRYVDVSFSIHLNRKHFKPLLVFFMMSCAVFIYSSLDLTMLGFMKTDYETGLYSIAAKGKGVLTMTGGLVWSSILPTATNLWKDGEKKSFKALADKAMVIVCGIQAFITIVCIVFAREIILFTGGAGYQDSVTSFRILMLSLVPIGASNILGGQVLIPAGKEKRLLTAEIAGAVFNFIANLILIPHFSINGAAFTTVVSEVIVWLICLYYARKDLEMDFFFEVIVKAGRKLKSISGRLILRIESRIKGDKLTFYCPCCDTHLKRFINGGFDKRPELYNIERYRGMNQDVICPLCHSLPRHRILVSYMNEHIEQFKDKEILHFAQERSVRMWMDRHGIRAVTADLFNPADLKIDIEDTGLESDSYDVIICNHVLEHVTDYRKALRELRRIVRPDGMIIISFPVDMKLDTAYEDNRIVTKEDRVRHFGQHDHLRVFGRDSKELLEHHGFIVEEIRGENCDAKIKPVVGPADYDYDVLWECRKEKI
ncbi:Membrane protein involved in the export of O-antigen and teichoic acid [Lachnospiraceae bacterium]|nr:Membrane protein involved in the export of O-antigen and teichoic acid [Lachnospiraceae bacterium]